MVGVAGVVEASSGGGSSQRGVRVEPGLHEVLHVGDERRRVRERWLKLLLLLLWEWLLLLDLGHELVDVSVVVGELALFVARALVLEPDLDDVLGQHELLAQLLGLARVRVRIRAEVHIQRVLLLVRERGADLLAILLLLLLLGVRVLFVVVERVVVRRVVVDAGRGVARVVDAWRWRGRVAAKDDVLDAVEVDARLALLSVQGGGCGRHWRGEGEKTSRG